VGKHEAYELESILRTVADEGSVTVPLRKLLRLLEKGNRAAGTWKALLDAWEDIDEDRANLHIAELPGQVILLSAKGTVPVTVWAGDRGAANSNLFSFTAAEAAS
jgi:hypothetical protein